MDVTITVGDLISAAGPIIAVVISFVKLSERLVKAEVRLEFLWGAYERRGRDRHSEGA